MRGSMTAGHSCAFSENRLAGVDPERSLAVSPESAGEGRFRGLNATLDLVPFAIDQGSDERGHVNGSGGGDWLCL
jgi:hypothetical protein